MDVTGTTASATHRSGTTGSTGATGATGLVWRRSAPLAAGAVLAAAAGYVAANDPADAGGLFPPCVFHAVSGLWCPGCGVTRGTHALLRGDVAAAVSSNVFTPLVVVVLVLTWFAWLRRAWGRPAAPLRVPRVRRVPAWASTALAASVVVYGVLRNVAGFEALAP